MKHSQHWLWFAPLTAGLVACAGPSGENRTTAQAGPTAPASGQSLAPEEARQAGRLYQAKCVRCHKSYDPSAYGETEWRSWMSKMSRKAKLKPSQEDLLSRFLDQVRAGQANLPGHQAR